MEITTQLALFLANKPGTLAAVCDALAAEKINIFGLTISDTVDHVVVRMVVSDYKRALSIFEEHGTLVLENEVLMLEHDNKPGTLSEIAKKLAAENVYAAPRLGRLRISPHVYNDEEDVERFVETFKRVAR